jgi:hypothetical protein
MQVEVLGQFRLEMSAMQLIHNGGWAAYLAIRTADDNHQTEACLLPYQHVVDEAVFESETAAIAGARRVAMVMLGTAAR